MTFCPQCGRPRAGDGRFCGTCGHEFAPPPADTGPASPAAPDTLAPGPVEPIRWDAPAAPPSWDTPAAPPSWDTPVAPPSWDAPPAPARWDAAPDVVHPETVYSGYESPAGAGEPAPEPANEPADQWAGWDNTVTAKPDHVVGYTAGYAAQPYTPPTPPAAPGPGFEPPPPGRQGQRPGSRRTGIFIAIAVVVVLAAGGGAYALAESSKTTAQPPSQPTITASPSAPTVAPSTVPPSPSPTASPSPSPTPSPTHTGTVQVAPGVADSAEPKVLAYLNRYFAAINAHNYNAYQSLLDAQGQQGDTQSSFESGYSTTKDSNEVLTGIQETGGGDVTANVSFTSQQSAASSVDGSTCDDWQISLYLVPEGSSYVKSSVVPSGYHAQYSDC